MRRRRQKHVFVLTTTALALGISLFSIFQLSPSLSNNLQQQQHQEDIRSLLLSEFKGNVENGTAAVSQEKHQVSRHSHPHKLKPAAPLSFRSSTVVGNVDQEIARKESLNVLQNYRQSNNQHPSYVAKYHAARNKNQNASSHQSTTALTFEKIQAFQEQGRQMQRDKYEAKHPEKTQRNNHKHHHILPIYNRTNPVKMIYFLHIHKAGGSALCHATYPNRLSANRKHNCNVQDDQRCCGHHDSFEAQVTFAQHSYYDFVASERELYESLAPEWYDYVTILRNSRDRYYSHYHHLMLAKDDKQDGVPNSFPEWWSGQPDNWSTRMICGPKCVGVGGEENTNNPIKYRISKDLFEYTLDRLAKFSDILFLESINASFTKFVQRHNWTNVGGLKVVNQKQNHTAAAAIIQKEQQDGWNPLMDALDNALYEFAQRKEANLVPFAQYSDAVQRELDHYFERGPLQNCTTLCCHECTVY